MSTKRQIYSYCKKIGLSPSDIEYYMNRYKQNKYDRSRTYSDANNSVNYNDSARASGVYKAGTWYGTVSAKDVYKAGTLYASVSPKDF